MQLLEMKKKIIILLKVLKKDLKYMKILFAKSLSAYFWHKRENAFIRKSKKT